MKKEEVIELIDMAIEENERYYDSIKEGKDFVEQGITLGRINGLIRARIYVINLE